MKILESFKIKQNKTIVLLVAPCMHITGSSGPSGSNTDYVLQLADALRQLGAYDPHIHALEALLVPD